MGQLEVEFTLKEPKTNARIDQTTPPQGRSPRVTRLVALAIKFQGMVDRGEVRDCADLARLGYVTRARISQIMNLLTLAPQIQEELLFLPKVYAGRDPITDRDLRQIARGPLWWQQRKLWKRLLAEAARDLPTATPPRSRS